MTTAPLVSVLMLAYNHSRFIRQAVESVLQQRVDFTVEILIGEDCSGDDTRAVLLALAGEHPGRLQLRLHNRNIGMSENYADLLSACRGEFVALLEGDDYWTNPQKLSRQVNFLVQRPECPLCFHDALVVGDFTLESLRRHYCEPKPPKFSTFADLMVRNFLPTCSVMFRRALLQPLPNALRKLPMQDWPSWALIARHGPLAFLDETWSCYRIHSGGAWSSQTTERQLRNALRFYAAMHATLGPAHRREITNGERPMLANLVELLVAEGRWRDARPPARRYLFLSPGRFRAPPTRTGLYWRLLLGWPSATMRGIATPSP